MAEIVAQRLNQCLVTEWAWIRIPMDAELFSPVSGASLTQIPNGGATLLIFL